MPIFKSEDRQECKNYHPISILPIGSKIFERSVFKQLYENYRPKNSTMTAVIQICDAWYASIENGDLNGVGFFIRKAFDSINYDILLRMQNERSIWSLKY